MNGSKLELEYAQDTQLITAPPRPSQISIGTRIERPRDPT